MAEDLTKDLIRVKTARTHARLTRLKLFEAFGIAAGLLAGWIILVVSGGFAALSPVLQALIFIGFTFSFIAALIFGFVRFRAPSKAEARATLDASHPEHPISALDDRPAVINASTKIYWARHRDRLKSILYDLKPPLFVQDWKRRDPLYLRFILPVAMIGVLGLNSQTAGQRLAMASNTDVGALFGASEIEVTAWLTPPDHTGVAPVFLDPETDIARIPDGTQLTVRVHGPGRPTLKRSAMDGASLDGRRSLRMEQMPDGAYETQLEINASQDVALHYWGKRASWAISADDDDAPSIEFVGEPEHGEDDQLTFEWSAEDDYGLSGVELLIRPAPETGLADRGEDVVALELTSSFAREVSDTTRLDLTRHKWAGLQVELRLRATDAAGQSGLSEPVVRELPEKLFLEPLALASQEIRLEVMREPDEFESVPASLAARLDDGAGLGDRLERAPEGIQQAALMLDAVTYKPELYFSDMTVYFGLRRAHEMLRFASTQTDVEPIDDLLWSVALRAEYGTVADAQRRLNAARRALENALRDGAGEDEIRRLMEAFRDAAEDYIAARMAEAILNGSEGAPPPEGGGSNETLGGNDLADMLDALEDLAETGATDAARQLLSDVTDLLNNLDFQTGGSSSGDMAGGQPGEGEQEDVPEEEQRLEGALDRLAEILEEQRRLNDETLQQRFGSDDGSSQEGQGGSEGEDSQGQDGNTPGEQGNGEAPNQGSNPNGRAGGTDFGDSSLTPAERFRRQGQMLAERQEDLADELRAFRNENGSESGVGEESTDQMLDTARRALEDAEQNLRRGDLAGAQWNQDRAIRAMREAHGEISEDLGDMREARRGENSDDAQSDPLGRPNGGTQQNDGEGVDVPDQADRQRARDILDSLRERLNNSTDPEEREYLERLLDRF